MNEKGFSHIFVILAVLTIFGLIGSVYYSNIQSSSDSQSNKSTQNIKNPLPVASASKEKTGDWKTYTSKDGLYTIDYPAAYIVKQEIASLVSSKSPNLSSIIQINAPCDYSYENQSKPDSCGGLEMYHVVVSVEKNLNNLDIDNWLKSSDLAPLKKCKRTDARVKIHKQDFLGNSAVVYDYVSDQDSVYGCAHDEIVGDWQTGFIKEIVVFHNQYVYKISVFYTLKDKIFVQDLLKIPETIKFLD